MTTFAVPAETTVVHIIAVVTTTAACRQTCFSAYRPLMTGLTCQTSMATIELERGTRVMVELPGLPVAGVVAHATILPKSTPVYVFLFMACAALGRRISEHRGQVAYFAFHLGMFAE